MDYIIDNLIKKGFKPESRREAAFVDELKDAGFVYFNKEQNNFKMKEEVVLTETPDEITLAIKPQINYLGLFPKADNFISSLNDVKTKHIMIEFLGKLENAEERLSSLLKGLNLGDEFSLTALGYGKNNTNEGYKLELPKELAPIMYKGNTIGYMTTGLAKGAKDRDTKNIDFVGVRPTKTLFKLGISTIFGVFYSLEDYKKAGKIKVIDKATMK